MDVASTGLGLKNLRTVKLLPSYVQALTGKSGFLILLFPIKQVNKDFYSLI